MCTGISDTSAISGAGKGAAGWFPLNQATVAFDHATHSAAEHALLLDFANYDLGTDARVALEMDLASGRVLLDSSEGPSRRPRPPDCPIRSSLGPESPLLRQRPGLSQPAFSFTCSAPGHALSCGGASGGCGGRPRSRRHRLRAVHPDPSRPAGPPVPAGRGQPPRRFQRQAHHRQRGRRVLQPAGGPEGGRPTAPNSTGAYSVTWPGTTSTTDVASLVVSMLPTTADAVAVQGQAAKTYLAASSFKANNYRLLGSLAVPSVAGAQAATYGPVSAKGTQGLAVVVFREGRFAVVAFVQQTGATRADPARSRWPNSSRPIWASSVQASAEGDHLAARRLAHPGRGGAGRGHVHRGRARRGQAPSATTVPGPGGGRPAGPAGAGPQDRQASGGPAPVKDAGPKGV